MTNRPRAIGTKTETAVTKFLVANGFPHAERRALRGTQDAGDITGIPGLCIEVKGGEAARNASDNQIEVWLADTERERTAANADVGMLILQRRGVGPANAGRWWAILPLGDVLDAAVTAADSQGVWRTYDTPVRMLLTDAVQLLRAAGYGQPLDDEEAA